MAINFKKLKAQVKRFQPEAKRSGYIFIATEEQKKRGIDSVAVEGSKNRFFAVLSWIIQDDEEYSREFLIK